MLIQHLLSLKGRQKLGGAPEGFDARLAAELAEGRKGLLVYVARDETRATAFEAALGFFAPSLPRLSFPAWDCLPYDRLGPRNDILARRISALSVLAERKAGAGVLVTTVNAILQRVPPRDWIKSARLELKTGGALGIEALTAWLSKQGYTQAGSVVEAGDFAVRGGIVDLFAPGLPEPVRVDFFGDEIETLRTFDPESQKSTGRLASLTSAAGQRGGAGPGKRQPVPFGIHHRFWCADRGRPALRERQRAPPLSGHGALATAVP
ncbi:MAG: hypothetical protein QM698_01420 [Micropepsaceae bacterium]